MTESEALETVLRTELPGRPGILIFREWRRAADSLRSSGTRRVASLSASTAALGETTSGSLITAASGTAGGVFGELGELGDTNGEPER